MTNVRKSSTGRSPRAIRCSDVFLRCCIGTVLGESAQATSCSSLRFRKLLKEVDPKGKQYRCGAGVSSQWFD